MVANLCAAVKITGAVDTEGPLRRLCGEPEYIAWVPAETVLARIGPSSVGSRSFFVLQRRWPCSRC